MKKLFLISVFIFSFIYSVFCQIQPTSSVYYADGIYSVVSDSATVGSKKVLLYRPSQLPIVKYPVFIFQPGANGIFGGTINVHTYDLFLQHLCSWGFVVLVIDETSAGMPNGATFKDVHSWFKNKAADTNHWLNSYADTSKVIIGGHSNGGVNASALLIDRPHEIHGIVYFASYPSDNILMPHDVSGYTGKVLSLAGSEDNSSTPSACKNGYNSFISSCCRTYVLITGLGHGGFGDYQHSSQVVGTIGRADATASIRHYLLSFMLSQFKNDVSAYNNLTQSILQPNTTGEFITNCNATVEIAPRKNELIFEFYPNPAMDYLYLNNKSKSVLNLQFINIRGQIVKNFKLNNTDVISVSQLTPGKYFIIVDGDLGYRQTAVFIKK